MGGYIKMTIQKVEWGHGLDSSGSGQVQVPDICKRGKEPSGSIKFGEILD